MADTSTNKLKIPVTDVELAFRAKRYPDIQDVQKKEIACATCNADLNAALQKSQNIFVHPILDTLQCKKCNTYYGDGDFSLDEDGTDKYCRFCGNGGNLYICGNSDCPYGFCKSCATKKVGQPLNKLEADDWQCLCCNPKPLWKLRAICASVITHCAKNQRKHGKNRSSGSVKNQLAEDDNPVESSDNDFERSESIRNFRTKLDRKLKKKKLHEKFEKLKNISSLCDDDDDESSPTPRIPKPFYEEKSSTSADEGAQLNKKPRLGTQKSDIKQQDDGRTVRERNKTNSDSKNSKQNVPSRDSKTKNQKIPPVQNSKSDEKLLKVQSNSKNKKTTPGINSKSSRDSSPKSNCDTDTSSSMRRQKKVPKTNLNKTALAKTKNSLRNTNHSSNSESEDESDSLETEPQKNVSKRKRKKKNTAIESNRSSKKMKKSRISDSDEESDSAKCKVSKKENENKAERVSIVSETMVDKKHRFSLSTEKPQVTKSRRLFSLGSEPESLEQKQSEKTNSKLSKSKEHVTKQQAKVIRKHVLQVVNQMKTLGSALSFSADKLTEKYLRNNMSRIDVATKAIHKSRLLMNRSMKKLRQVDKEFTSSCAFWGKDSKVPSIATVLEPFSSDNEEIADLDTSMPTMEKDENVAGDSHALEQSSLLDLENPGSPDTPAKISSDSKNPATANRADEKSNKESNDEEEDPELKNSDEEMEESPTDPQTKTVSKETEQSEAAASGLSSRKNRSSNEEMNNNSDSESETLHDSRNALDSAHLSTNENDSSPENSGKNLTTDQSSVKAKDSRDVMPSENDEVETNGTASRPLVEEPIVSTDERKSDEECAGKKLLRRKGSSDHDTADVQESTDSFDLVDKSPADSVKEPDQNKKQEIEVCKSAKNQRTECNEAKSAVHGEKEPDNKDTASINNEMNGLDGMEDPEKSDCENHGSPPPGNEHSNDDGNSHRSPESSNSNKSSRRNSKNKRSKSSRNVSPASSTKDEVGNVALDEEPSTENDRCQSSDRELFENSQEMENECIENSQPDVISSDKKLFAQDNDEIIGSDLETTLDPEKPEKKSSTAENEKKKKKDTSEQDLADRDGDETENVIMSSSNSEADNLEKCDVQWKDSETDSDEKLLRDTRSEIESANARQLETAEHEVMKDTSITSDTLESEEELKRKILEHESDLSAMSEEGAAPNEAELNNSEEERKRKMLGSDSELSDIRETLSPAASPANSDAKINADVASSEGSKSQASRNSEEELKRKILESDSDEPEGGEITSESLQNRVVDTLQKIFESDTDTSDVVALSQKSDSRRKADKKSTSTSKSSNESTKLSKPVNKKSSSSSKSTDAEDTDINAIAKKQLLSSSDDSDISDLGTPRIKVRSFANEFGNVDADNTDTLKSGNSDTSKSKRKKFNIKKNSHYANDKKLQMICQVVVRRLNEKVLDQFANVLDKSKQRQAHKSFQSLVDLKSLKARKKRGTSSATSDSDNKSSSPNPGVTKTQKKKKTNVAEEKEETLMDHLEKVQNGENTENSTDDEMDESTTKSKTASLAESHDVFDKKANDVAKSLLINSSDSEIDNQAPPDNEEEEDEKSKAKSKKKSRKKNEKKSDSKEKRKNGDGTNSSDDEAKEDEEKSTNEKDSDSEATLERKKMKKKLDKRNWKISDSDTSDDERRLRKSQKKKSAIQSDADTEKPVEMTRKKGSKGKRRVLNSDSDSPKLSDSEENEKETVKKKTSESENSDEIFERLKKKKRKRKQNDTSDSDSSPQEKSKKTKRKRIKKIASDSDSENQDSSQESPGKSHRKNIRKVLKDKQVADQTKMAGKEEEERLKRIAERQKLYNEMYEMKLAGEEKVDKLVLDFDEETKKELITVHPELVKRLKPHQAQGIKFMWDACYESLEQIKSTKGSGCILAHCMGLGKSFQVVTLSHTLLTHPETGVKTVMVVCPLSTVLNWVNEFKSWLHHVNDGDDVEVFEMTKLKKNFERKYALQSWQKSGGVMIIGYEMFRILSNATGKKMRKNMQEAILQCLVDPGPDLIICDEGHLLKNEDTALSKAMKRVKTLRRVVLTGTPLQNNLTEYHCMVQFVKPNLLGTKKEFLNRFVNPITNGQFDDSTEYDVKLMKKRAHVLHKMLEGSVQRFDYSVLTPFLPPKQEYVISVRLSEIQIELYQYYIDNLSRHKVGVGGSLFADFQALQRIWTHPVVLRMNAEKTEKKKRLEDSDSEGSLKDFLDDGSEDSTSSNDDSDVQSVRDSNEETTTKSQRRTRGNPIDDDEEEPVKEEETESTEWWSQFVKPEHFEDLRISAKLVLLFAILKESEQLGDKVLVFSQSLYALTLIEDFLEKIDESTQNGGENELLENHTGSWYLGLDYFRLDGQTTPESRNQYCKIFNNPKNTRARLFLISTRAGGLGINLTAANRVIIFDASWNPSHDVQSIFRIYRFGQKKPCYVYRFLAQGTMEEKIYNRQVTKLSLSCRVVDEQQIERHYSNHDLAELYQFEPNTSTEKPTLALPRDRLLAEIFLKYKDYIETYHEHDSLLENKAEEELDEEERKEAWKEYEEERKGLRMNMNYMPNQNMLLQQYAMTNPNFAHNQADIANRAALSGFNFDTLQALIQKDYPNATPEQQKMITTRAVLDMYNYMENQAVRQHQPMISTPTNNFNYPTMTNIGPASFTDNNAALQYNIQQQQQQQALLQMQRKQQMNYAQRFGNVPNTIHTPIQEIQIDDHDVIEMESEPRLATPSTGTATASSTATVPPVVPVLNNKRQEE